MLKRIAFAGLLLCLFIAIPLAVMGIERVDLGTPFLSFMKNVSFELSKYKLEIPKIPTIEVQKEFSGAWLVIDFLIKVVNFLINIMNLFIGVINVVIQFVQMIFLIVKGLINLKSDLASQSTATSSALVSAFL